MTRVYMLCLSLLLTGLLSGCNSLGAMSAGDQARSDAHAIKDAKLVLLPPSIFVFDKDIDDEKVIKEWSLEARRYVENAVRRNLLKAREINLSWLPVLDTQDQEMLLQHMLLYYPVVSGQRFRAEHLSIGPGGSKGELGAGLQFLHEKYGIDLVVIASGADYHTSNRRKAVATLAATMGAYVETGTSYLDIGLIDVNSGAVVWNENIRSHLLGFRTQADVDAVVDELFQTAPGV